MSGTVLVPFSHKKAQRHKQQNSIVRPLCLFVALLVAERVDRVLTGGANSRVKRADAASEQSDSQRNQYPARLDLDRQARRSCHDELRQHFHVGKYEQIPEARWVEVTEWFKRRIDAAQKRRGGGSGSAEPSDHDTLF